MNSPLTTSCTTVAFVSGQTHESSLTIYDVVKYYVKQTGKLIHLPPIIAKSANIPSIYINLSSIGILS